MQALTLFHLDETQPNFESFGQNNGTRFWYARDLMGMLGYESADSFQKAVNKAIGACTTLGIPVLENFEQIKREVDRKAIADYKLSRFACYLVAMNGDVKKPQVAAAQAYFAGMAEAVRTYVESGENVERLLIRDDVSERERSLSGVARSAGVENYGFFQNAGYRGMYNMDLSRLKAHKRVDSDRSLLDFMGRQELAANLFRLTETEAKIRNENVRGQKRLENTAEQVGRTVRSTMIRTSGSRPEHLPLADDIKLVRRGLKAAHKEFKKIDEKRQRTRSNVLTAQSD